MFKKGFLLFLFPLCIISCKSVSKEGNTIETIEKNIEKPLFSADSTYRFIEEQIAFGPRIPNTPAQKKCADYLSNKLKQYGAEVIIQTTKLPIYNGQIVPCYNIIGSFNP
ncbi:MAG: glutamine cyclotransferase, partial [Bacteroidetes bacterium]|nr:glutamine cyclotransferase [Bacteroidota bacterium]